MKVLMIYLKEELNVKLSDFLTLVWKLGIFFNELPYFLNAAKKKKKVKFNIAQEWILCLYW